MHHNSVVIIATPHPWRAFLHQVVTDNPPSSVNSRQFSPTPLPRTKSAEFNTLDPMGRLHQFLFAATLTAIPNCVEALTWGDFHIFAVIFFSFVGGFMGLGAIFGALYIACGKPFLDRFRDEVVILTGIVSVRQGAIFMI